jgi:hypothetical protein
LSLAVPTFSIQGGNLKSLSLLIALKEMEGSHSNENIAAAILPVFGNFRIEDKLGFSSLTTINTWIN